MKNLRSIIYNIIIQLAIILYFSFFTILLVAFYIYLCEIGFNLIELFIRLQTIPVDELPEWVPDYCKNFYVYVQKNYVPFIIIPIFIRQRSIFYSVNKERYLFFFSIIFALNYFFFFFPIPWIVDIILMCLNYISSWFLDASVIEPFFHVLIIFWHNLFIPFLLYPILYTNIDKKFFLFLFLFLLFLIVLFLYLPI